MERDRTFIKRTLPEDRFLGQNGRKKNVRDSKTPNRGNRSRMAGTKIFRRMVRPPFEKTLKKSLKVSAEPALGGVEGLNELRRGAGEGVAGAEGVIGSRDHQDLVLASGQPPARLDRHGLVLVAVDDQPG